MLAGPRPGSNDQRTTALMRPAIAFLESLGLADVLRDHAAPLASMRIVDVTERLVRSPTVTFHAAEIDEEHFGLNVPNAPLTAAMAEIVNARGKITWHESLVDSWRLSHEMAKAKLSDGSVIKAALAVAADGRNSLAREAAGISVRRRSLPQKALVLNFGHARHHGFTSTEFHTVNGPCTQVPLPGGFHSSLVWVTRPDEADELAALDPKMLSERLETKLHSFLGRVTIESARQVYPLSVLSAQRFAAQRVVLVGEAAHVFPPITAQGLNLGIRDVKDLSDIVREHADDPGSIAALTRYDAVRRPDIVARSSAVNLLNTSLLSSLLPAQLARSAGLGMLDRVPAFRGFFMREGMRPGSGFEALLPSIRLGHENQKRR